MRIIAKIAAGILFVILAGAYFQLGLYLTTSGTPIPLMYGVGQWLAWLFVPIVVSVVLADEFL